MVTTRRSGGAATPAPPTPEDIAAAAAAEATRRNNAIKPFQFGGADAKLRGVAARPVDSEFARLQSDGVQIRTSTIPTCPPSYDDPAATAGRAVTCAHAGAAATMTTPAGGS